jgi:hypothetical protein
MGNGTNADTKRVADILSRLSPVEAGSRRRPTLCLVEILEQSLRDRGKAESLQVRTGLIALFLKLRDQAEAYTSTTQFSSPL